MTAVDNAYKLLCLQRHRDGPDRVLDRFLAFMSHTDVDFLTRSMYYNDAYLVLKDLDEIEGSKEVIRMTKSIFMFSLFCMHVCMDARPKDVEITLEVTLEELYIGRAKRLNMNILKCFKKVPKTIYIDIIDPVEKYTFKGEGDQYVPFGLKSDIVITLTILTHSSIRTDNIISPFDLHTDIIVPFNDYLFGTMFQVKHLDGRIIDIEYPSQSGKRVHVIHGYGLPQSSTSKERGSLYVFFEVRLPIIDLMNPVTNLILKKVFG